MKFKIAAAVFGALLLVVGAAWGALALVGGGNAQALVPMATATATATTTVTNYTGSVGTECWATASAGSGNTKVAYTFGVKIQGGSAAPAGTYSFKIYKDGVELTGEAKSTSSGNGETGNTGTGLYKVVFDYAPGTNSTYRPCHVEDTYTRK